MSLIDRMAVDCELLKCTRTPDGEGGFTTVWTSTPIAASIIRDTSGEALYAEKLSENAKFIIAFAPTYTAVAYGDFIRRTDDGAVFRVTSNPEDEETPTWMAVRFKQCTAARTELPS